MKTLENWKTDASRTVFSAPPWVSVLEETVALPSGEIVEPFYRVKMRDFVCIYPEIDDGSVLTLTQYKHGPRCVSLTFPGGHLEDDENPLECARRELLEETGYEARSLAYLGGYTVNANQGCATGHLVRAQDCRKITSPNSGDLEEMEIVAMDVSTLWERARAGDLVLLNQLALLAIATHPEFRSEVSSLSA